MLTKVCVVIDVTSAHCHRLPRSHSANYPGMYSYVALLLPLRTSRSLPRIFFLSKGAQVSFFLVNENVPGDTALDGM